MDRVVAQTDDKRRLYLVVKNRHQWAEEYLGKRIKATGILVPRKDTARSVFVDTLVDQQPKLKNGDTIRNARWKVGHWPVFHPSMEYRWSTLSAAFGNKFDKDLSPFVQ